MRWLLAHRYSIGITFLVFLLLGKFLAPLFLYELPLGYDPGIYRYLFLKYADSIRHFSLPELLPWASEHPPGLFVLAAPFLIAGLPVDVLIGFVWNLIPVLLLCVLSIIISKREGRAVGVCVLLIGLLSQAYYDGFFAMYMKAYVSLLFTILTYYLAEKRSMWFVLTALTAVMVHQQTGLVLTLSLGLWWILSMRKNWSDKKFRVLTYILGVAAIVAILWYIPQWERAIWSPLKSIFLLRGDKAPSGAFPDAAFYVRTMAVVLLLGIFGLAKSFTKERGSLWQLSVLVCAVFIMFRLVFYKRFFLQLDFFLIPFAASALVWIWKNVSTYWARGLLLLIIITQAIVGFQVVKLRTPGLSQKELSHIVALPSVIEKNATVIALENTSGVWLRGWLSNHSVGAPGLFDNPGWSYKQWETFIDGSDKERKRMLRKLQRPVYFLLSPSFARYYQERAEKFIKDPCFRVVDDAPLLKSICSKK